MYPSKIFAIAIILYLLTQPLTISYIEAKKKSLQKVEIEIKEHAADCKLKCAEGDTVDVHYDGYLIKNGQLFDSSRKRGQAFSVLLGAGKVIPGWEQGLIGMCVGETREIRIPSKMAYGARGVADVIPPNSDLKFVVELISIDKSSNSVIGTLQLILRNPVIRVAMLVSLILSVLWQCFRSKPKGTSSNTDTNDNTSKNKFNSRAGKKSRSRMDK